MILRGGRFGPWRFIPGTVSQGFRPNFAGVGGAAGFPGVSDDDENCFEDSNRILQFDVRATEGNDAVTDTDEVVEVVPAENAAKITADQWGK